MFKLASLVNASRMQLKFSNVRRLSSRVYTSWRHNDYGKILLYGSGIIGIAALLKMTIESRSDIHKFLPKAIEKAKIKEPFKNNHVHVMRKSVEHDIDLAMTSRTGYYVVYGPKGMGKSEIVHQLAMDRAGFIKLDIHSAHSREDIIHELSKKLLGEHSTNVDMDTILEAIGKCKIMPTIILDVEHSGVMDQKPMLDAIRSFAKAVSRYGHCIVVLSETSDALEFGYDLNCEHFIYVDELTIDEARSMLRTLQLELDAKDVQYVFDNLGTCPAMLEALGDHVRALKPIERFVESCLAAAERDLSLFPHQQILKALKEHPEGYPPKYFNNQMHGGVNLSDPKAVMTDARMKSKAVVYCVEDGKYRLRSTAHMTALKKYEPNIA